MARPLIVRSLLPIVVHRRRTPQKETKHLTRPFVPRRDVSCRLALPPGQFAIVATTLDPGRPGRFWIHVKADCNFTLQPSAPGAAITGSKPGECDIRLREMGTSVGLAYNEMEEDAEGNGRAADVASMGTLLTSVRALASRLQLVGAHATEATAADGRG